MNSMDYFRKEDYDKIKFLKIIDSNFKKVVFLGELDNQKIIVTIFLFHTLDEKKFISFFKSSKLKQLDNTKGKKVRQTSGIMLTDENSYCFKLSKEHMIEINFKPREYEFEKSDKYILMKETPEDYEKIILPYLKKTKRFDDIQWITNIFDSTKNQDQKIFYTTTKYCLTNSYICKFFNIKDSLHFLILFNNLKDLKSIRDLKKEHINLLKEVQERTKKELKKLYPNIKENEWRFFIHYHPSFWSLHIHVTHLHNFFASCSERAHMLDDVIDNLEKYQNYYQNKSFIVQTYENSVIMKMLKK